MKINFKKLFLSGWLVIVLSSCFLALLPVQILAQSVNPAPADKQRCDNFQQQFKVGSTNLASNGPFFCSASQTILIVINYAFVISGTVTVLFIIVGGFWYLTSGGNEEQTEKGKKTLINSVIGLVVITLSYTIVRIVSSVLALGK